MIIAAYRLTNMNDPEERLEDAALWKAMYDEYGDEIELVEEPSGEVPTFGRQKRNETKASCPVTSDLPYWNDPAFLANCGRSFKVCDFKEAEAEVDRLHAEGKGAFLKSTRSKHSIIQIDVGTNFIEGMDAMAYSFMDGGPNLMVQEMCDITNEHRFFVIDRQIVTQSPVQYQLTPIDYPLPEGATYSKPNVRQMDIHPDVVEELHVFAQKVASVMNRPHASVDCALINGKPAVIEFNPMHLGQLGLYACDVRALARASRTLLPEQVPLRAMTYIEDGVRKKVSSGTFFS